MAKLSQQLQQADDSRLMTRTERVKIKQARERELRSFQNLKSQAEKKQEEFSDVKSIDEYEEKYKSLDENLKQFFQTPQDLRVAKTQRIETTKQAVQEKFAYADQKITDAKTKYDENVARAQELYARDRKKGRSDARERYKEKVDRYEDDFEETSARWQGYKKGLNKGLQELNQNKDVEFKDIENYASDLGRYEEAKKEARNEERKFKKDQELERKKLEEAGYKPQVIQKFFKGQPTSVGFDWYNPETKDWISGTEYKVDAPVDVKGLKRLGYSEPQIREIEFGGKTYEFKSSIGIYKTPTGEVVTPYQKTGVTEAELIKQSQDTAYKDWSKERTTKPIITDLPDSKGGEFGIGGYKYTPTSDIVGYVNQGTISTQQEYIQVPLKRDYSPPSISNLYKKIPEGSFGYLGWIDITKTIKGWGEWAGEKKAGALSDLGKLEAVSPKLEELETKYQEEGQLRFEDLYSKKIIYGEMTPEQAEKDFLESESYSLMLEKYGKEYQTTFDEATARENIGWGQAFKSGGKILGYSALEFGLGRIATPKKAVETGAVLYGAYKVIPLIPKAVVIGAEVGIGAKAGYTLAKGSTSPTEVVSSTIELALVGATLGYAGYKYLRTPVVRKIKIPAPTRDLKASQTLGKDIKFIKDKGELNKILFGKQKLAQYGFEGQRTIVTTKWREIARKGWLKMGVKPSIARNYLYEGIPTQQLAKSYSVAGLRGTTTIKVGKSGYQKAYDLLREYGYSKYQATSTLRYTAPKIIDVNLKSGVLNIKGSKSFGEFVVGTRQPVIDVNKKLGIKTRGAGEITDVYKVERILSKNGKFALELREKGSLFVSKGGKATLTLGESPELRKLVSFGRTWKGQDNIQDIFSFSKKIYPKAVVESPTRTTLLKQTIREKELYGVRYVGGKKTPLSKTFADDVVEKVTKPDIVTPSSTKTDIFKVAEKLDDTSKIKASEWAGSGMYEQTFGGANLKQLSGTQQLRTIISPDVVKTTALKDLIKVKQLDAFVGLDVATLGATATMSQLKVSPELKMDLKAKMDLKTLLKEDVAVKTAQTPALKTSPQLRSDIKTILELSPVITTPVITTPTIRIPRTPDITKPRRVPIDLPFLKAKVSGMKKGGVGKQVFERAYLPDFTSRALGLTSETISEKQAKKKLKQVLSGLEIRRGVKIK